MGLQVRLRHALGERLFDLPDRSADNPLLIGRAREAEVKIPSVTVAAKHCALFLHDNQWLLQDTSGGYTWLNGNPTEGPTPLSIGDIITLGSDATPATLEIDPAAVALGRTGEPAETDDVRAPAAGASSMPVARGSTSKPAAFRPPQAGTYYAPAPPPPPQMNVAPAPQSDAWGEAPAADDAFEGWGQSAGASGTGAAATPRRKPKKKSSDVGLIVGICFCVAIVIGVAVFVFKRLNPAPPPTTAQQQAPSQKFVYGKQSNPTFSEHQEGEVVTAPGSSITPVAPTPNSPDSGDTASPTPSDTGETTSDVHKGDKAWEEVEAANNSPDIGVAILKFDDYRKQHPGISTRELDAYTDSAMDRLWWKRIVNLCAQRDQLNKDIKAKEKDIKEEPSPAFKKTLQEEKSKKDKELAIVQNILAKDMSYTSDDAPDLDNKEMMARLTGDRDASKFGTWKLQTLSYIRVHRGAMPWDG